MTLDEYTPQNQGPGDGPKNGDEDDKDDLSKMRTVPDVLAG
jgi:hypothetical protein